MPSRLSEKIAPWIEKAVDAHRGGDAVHWEMALHQLPTGGFGLAVVSMIPGAILGSFIHSVTIVGNPMGMVETEADEMVRGMIENLRTERSKQLAPANGEGEVHEHEHGPLDLPHQH